MWCSSKDYNKKERRKKMAIFMTDTHGYFGRLRPAAFREQGDLSKDDCRCRLFGHYRDNRVSKVKPILRIVQICQYPYRQAVKERAAQRRFFLYCFATKTAKWASEKVIWQLPSISFDRVENRITAHGCSGSVGKVEECFWSFLLIDCGSAACYTGSNKRTGVDSDMDTLMEFSIQGDIFFSMIHCQMKKKKPFASACGKSTKVI